MPTTAAAAVTAALTLVSPLALAAAVPFSATAEGVSSIVEVINPVGPEVRVQTEATGTGTPGPLTYRSGDIINLATGQGSGSNRFVLPSGDELLGSFSVQMVPGADASLFELIGDVVFQGGTGVFQGATGGAAFRGNGQFFSATEARTRFVFQGTLNAVPEPPAVLLVGLALACMCRASAVQRLRVFGACPSGASKRVRSRRKAQL